MLRDKNRSEEYFKSRYEKDEKRLQNAIKEYEDILSTQGENAPGLKLCYLDIVNKAYLKFITGYSYGILVEQLIKEVNLIIDFTLKSWDGTIYGEIERALELAVIFDIRDNKILELIESMRKFKFQDKYTDILANYISPNWKVETDKIQFKKVITPLVAIIETANGDKTTATSYLKKYLDKQWLNMQKEGIITNKDYLTKDRYRGYWSIESAAVAKISNINVEQLDEILYFPFDLLK